MACNKQFDSLLFTLPESTIPARFCLKLLDLDPTCIFSPPDTTLMDAAQEKGHLRGKGRQERKKYIIFY